MHLPCCPFAHIPLFEPFDRDHHLCCPQSQAVAEQDVVHFDLKCDNILLEAMPGVPDKEFWTPTADVPPFKVVLADFGDSCDFSLSEDKFTTRQADLCSV